MTRGVKRKFPFLTRGPVPRSSLGGSPGSVDVSRVARIVHEITKDTAGEESSHNRGLRTTTSHRARPGSTGALRSAHALPDGALAGGQLC